MNLPLRYEDFLAAKVAMAPVSGFVVEDHEINPLLKPHQKASVKWACMGGRRALFLAFGLGKTFVQIEVLRLVQEKFGNGEKVGKPMMMWIDDAKRALREPRLKAHRDKIRDLIAAGDQGDGQPIRGWINQGGYSRARWQLDAHGYMRVGGNRLLAPEEIRSLDANVIFKLWKAYQLDRVYDFEHHVKIAEGLEEHGSLPSTFMLLPTHSGHDDVWTDITRMLSMNTLQAQAGREMHLCPLQFDIIDRCVAQYSEPGEVVFDPFGGLMSVPYRAIRLGRQGRGVELNPGYFLDGCQYVKAMADELAMPDLFGLMGIENEEEKVA